MHHAMITRSPVYSLDFIKVDVCSDLICYIFPLGPILNHVQLLRSSLFPIDTKKTTKKNNKKHRRFVGPSYDRPCTAWVQSVK